MKKSLLLLWILIFNVQTIFAQSAKESTKEPLLKKSSLIILPLAFYTPETRFGGGVASIYAFRFRGEPDKSKPSQFQVGLAYTAEKQLLIYFPFQLYLKNEDWFLNGELGYYRYVYQFFGIGNETNKDDQESYDANYPRVRFNALKKVADNLYLGGRYWFDDYEIPEITEGGTLDNQEITGKKGGVISGLGLVANFDTRNHVFYPSKGSWVDASLFTNQEWLGSDFNFTRLSVDWSRYFSKNENHVFAINLFSEFIFGDPPFQQLAFIGGSKKMRGYFEGRFRNKKLMILQAEYRLKIWKWLGVVFFTGAGNVGESIGDLTKEKIHYSIGSGLRFQLSKKDKINLRVDVGFDEKGNWLPYLTLGEAF